MNFSTSIKTCVQKYAGFSGRATRSEYWWFYLLFMVGYLVLATVTFIINQYFIILLGLFSLFILLPLLAAGVRRLHDVNRSGWWILLSFVPLASLALMYFQVQPSDIGDNQYGPPSL
jgi:uncharacterized membrane protein YhaH (DUF805 family)